MRLPAVMLRLAASLSFALACCGTCPRVEPLALADGGAVACLRSTDCPRQAFQLVCSNDLDRARGCVGCADGRCARWVPEACR